MNKKTKTKPKEDTKVTVKVTTTQEVRGKVFISRKDLIALIVQ